MLTGLSSLVWAALWRALADAVQRHQCRFRLSIRAAMARSVVPARVTRFWTLVATVVLFAFSGTPIVPLMDYYVLE